jgi:hypothetical protein
MFLAGVFLNDAEPADPAPTRLSFESYDFVDLYPTINQVFFIGDGLTSSGGHQRFHVPEGGTRLFLGFVDGYDFGALNHLPDCYNDNGGSVQADLVIEEIEAPNQPPVLDPIGNRSVNEGQTLTFTLSATDPDPGQTLSYSASNLPTGANFDPATLTFTWTPASGSAGTYQVTFTVTDNGTPPLSASQAITISVGAVNRPPVLSGSKTVNEGQTLSFTVSSSDPDPGQVLTYSASSLPSGATFNPATQTFTWTPDYTQAGNYQVTFTVTDNGTPPQSASEAITITVGDVNRPPVLNPIGNQTVNEGQTLSFTVTGSDPDGNALTYAASNLPSGASFDAATQTFTWTPASGSAGTYQVTFTVTDNGTPPLSASQTVKMTVAASSLGSSPIEVSLTVKPSPVNLATSQPKQFNCLIGLPQGYDASQIVRSSLRLSVPSCPACGEDASPSGALQGGLYAAKFRRSFLATAPLGQVRISVTGQLTDGTPFEGTTTVQTWKPLALGDIDLTDAKGQPETQFAKNEPMVFLRCSYEVDPRAGAGKVSALVNAFGRKFRSPWQPVSAGANTLGYTVLVPASAATGPQDVKVTLQLKKAGKVIDTEVRTLHIEVLAQPTDDWQP